MDQGLYAAGAGRGEPTSRLRMEFSSERSGGTMPYRIRPRYRSWAVTAIRLMNLPFMFRTFQIHRATIRSGPCNGGWPKSATREPRCLCRARRTTTKFNLCGSRVSSPSLAIACHFPAASRNQGHAYRARVRVIDDTGRASHWSEPVQFIASPGVPADLLDGLRISEVHYNPAGPSVEEIAARLCRQRRIRVRGTRQHRRDNGRPQRRPIRAVSRHARYRVSLLRQLDHDPRAGPARLGRREHGRVRLSLRRCATGRRTVLRTFEQRGRTFDSRRGRCHAATVCVCRCVAPEHRWSRKIAGDRRPRSAVDAWDQASSWQPSDLDGGTPGVERRRIGDANGDDVFDELDLQLVFEAGRV